MTPNSTDTAAAKKRGRPSDGGRFLRIADVIATTGLSRATIYRLVAAEDFPRQHSLTRRCIGWWQADIDAWLRARLRPSTTEG